MLVFDRLLVSGLSFVFDKVATIADAERNDAEKVREALLAIQIEFEDGRIDDATFRARESELIARLREIRKAAAASHPGEIRVTGVEARFETYDGSTSEVRAASPRRAVPQAERKKAKKKSRRPRKA